MQNIICNGKSIVTKKGVFSDGDEVSLADFGLPGADAKATLKRMIDKGFVCKAEKPEGKESKVEKPEGKESKVEKPEGKESKVEKPEGKESA